ncbi:MAG TPA: S-layer homology domain-containing protein [Leptolyngbyaceae cyanobacterium]
MLKTTKSALTGIIFLGMTIIANPLAAQTVTTSETSQATPTDATNYGCISGYSDGTYRGDRAITRDEFAAALNACLNQIDRQLENNQTNQVTREDIVEMTERLNRYRQELQDLNHQLDDLESEQK